MAFIINHIGKTIFVFFIVSIATVNNTIAQEKVAAVYSIKKTKNLIVIASPKAGLLFKMGDLVYVPTDEKNIILTVTFPMQTVAKCNIARSHQKYLPAIKRGMPVYRYEPGKTLQSLQKDFERVDEIRLYNGRILRGAVISRGVMYLILTPEGKVKIPEKQIKNIRIIR